MKMSARVAVMTVFRPRTAKTAKALFSALVRGDIESRLPTTTAVLTLTNATKNLPTALCQVTLLIFFQFYNFTIKNCGKRLDEKFDKT